MTLKERIANDTYRVFLRVDDYADTHKICTNSKDSELVIASLQANEVDLSAGNGIALQLAMAASPISLAKLLSSWTQNASAHLISSTQSGRTQIFNKLLWMN